MRLTMEDIRKHWEEAGQSFPTEWRITPTSRDPYLGQLEEENILDFLRPDQVVLEMGCGDGSHSVKYARQVKELSALDLIENLLNRAKQRAADAQLENMNFTLGSVLALKELYPAGKFDCLISQRCLINLAEWELQQEAFKQAHSLLREGGLLLMTEGFQDAMDELNVVRSQFGLPEIAVAYNRNFIRPEFEAFIGQYFEPVEVRHYGGYLFLSRVFHPLAVLPAEPKHDARINEVAMEISRAMPLPDLDKYSYNSFYALRKNSLKLSLAEK